MLLADNKTLEGLGAYLSGERDKRGYTRRDLAIKTKIPLGQLAYMEEGQIDKIRPVFAKGFLRAYANELTLDAEDILQVYRDLFEGKNDKKMKSLASIYHETNGAGIISKLLKFLVFLLILAVIGIIAYYKVPFIYNLINKPLEGINSVVLTEGVDESPSILEGENTIAESVAASLEEENLLTNNSVTLSTEGGILELNFYKDAWVEFSVDGEKTKYLTFKAGDKRVWEIEKEASIIAKPLNAFKVKWNGKDLGYLGDHSVGALKFPLK